MLKEPNVPLTKSSIEAEIQRIQREVMRDLVVGGAKKIPALEAELKSLRDYVRENKDKIAEE
jgi:hypothetical protein